jgi:hypothetical protein
MVGEYEIEDGNCERGFIHPVTVANPPAKLIIGRLATRFGVQQSPNPFLKWQ